MATNSENFMNLIYDYNCLIERERERDMPMEMSH